MDTIIELALMDILKRNGMHQTLIPDAIRERDVLLIPNEKVKNTRHSQEMAV
jgi:hypothetical protein